MPNVRALRPSLRGRSALPLLRVGMGAAVGVVCLGLGACGSSRLSAASAGRDTLAFSQCVRAHGVSGFPDPGGSTAGSSSDNVIMIAGIVVPPSIDIDAPVVRSALQSCQKYLFPNGRPKVSSTQKTQLIVQAQCMRTHGVPGYPDPQFPTGGGINIFTGPGVDTSSPGFQAALKACGGG